MKIERTKNAVRNLRWGILNKVVGLLLPFVCRAAIIRIFGMNYLGLSSLYTSILSALSLAELGFGSAVVFFMYKAVAEDDDVKICALMNYYKKVYRVVGCVVLLCGLALMPFLDKLIKQDIPADLNLYLLYLITLLGTVISYFLYAYKNCILTAYQRNDIVVNVQTSVMLIERVLQLVFIFFTKNYYLYVMATVLTNIVNNIAIAIIVRKRYPQYCARGNIEKGEKQEIGTKIKGLLLYKVGNVVMGSADNIIMASFLGLTITGMYGNYYYVITALFGFLGIYYNAIRAGLGNSIVTETIEKNYSDFSLLQFLQNWVVGWCAICLVCLFQDFILIYAGYVAILDFKLVILLSLVFYVWKVQDVVHVYKEAGGMWDTDKYRPLVSSIINLAVNIILVQLIGLYGIVISTLIVLIIVDIPWASDRLFKGYFNKSKKLYYLMLINGFLLTICLCIVTMLVCSLITFKSVILRLFIKAIICLIVPNLLFVIVNLKNKNLQKCFARFKSILIKNRK